MCLLRKHAFILLATNFGKLIPTTAYQTFLFLPDSTELDRACSSDVYSILRTKAVFWQFMLMWTVDRHIITRPWFCHVPSAIITHMRKQCVPGALSPAPPPYLGTRLQILYDCVPSKLKYGSLGPYGWFLKVWFWSSIHGWQRLPTTHKTPYWMSSFDAFLCKARISQP